MSEYTHDYMKRKTLCLVSDVVTHCQCLIQNIKTNSNLPYDVHFHSLILTLSLCRDLSRYLHFDSEKE